MEFNSLSEAEEALQIDYVGGTNFCHGCTFNTPAPVSSTPRHSIMVDEPLSPVIVTSVSVIANNKRKY
jgi:hypothetical protein